MRVLVTGGTGFIGSHLVPSLIEHGAEVTLLTRISQPSWPSSLARLRANFSVVFADLRNAGLTARALAEAQPEYVVHLAAAGAADPFLSIQTALRHNLYGTLNLIQACYRNTRLATLPRKVIIARTSGETSAMNVYAATKAAAWNICQMYSNTEEWPIIGLKIFQAYGSGQPAHTLVEGAFNAAMQNEDFPMTSGMQKRDWIYITDVIRGLLAALKADLTPGTSLDLGTGQTTPLVDVVWLIYRLVGSSAHPRPGLLPDRPGEKNFQAADADRAKKLLDWRAEMSLEMGLNQILQIRLDESTPQNP